MLLYMWCFLSGTTGSEHTLHSLCMSHSGHVCALIFVSVTKLLLSVYIGSVVLTQTHPATPYVCRTGNITLRCQYDGVENVFSVAWVIGVQITSNASTIPGHTALLRTTAYQEVVVDSYTNLAAGYRCVPTLSNGSRLNSNTYIPQEECECHQSTTNFHCSSSLIAAGIR